MGFLITEDQRVAVETQGIAGLPSNLMATLAANHARILDFFRDADTNADGCISKNEMRFALFKLGMNASPSDVHQLFGMLDKDGNGVLQFGELQDALLAVKQQRKGLRGMPPWRPKKRAPNITEAPESSSGAPHSGILLLSSSTASRRALGACLAQRAADRMEAPGHRQAPLSLQPPPSLNEQHRLHRRPPEAPGERLHAFHTITTARKLLVASPMLEWPDSPWTGRLLDDPCGTSMSAAPAAASRARPTSAPPKTTTDTTTLYVQYPPKRTQSMSAIQRAEQCSLDLEQRQLRASESLAQLQHPPQAKLAALCVDGCGFFSTAGQVLCPQCFRRKYKKLETASAGERREAELVLQERLTSLELARAVSAPAHRAAVSAAKGGIFRHQLSQTVRSMPSTARKGTPASLHREYYNRLVALANTKGGLGRPSGGSGRFAPGDTVIVATHGNPSGALHTGLHTTLFPAKVSRGLRRGLYECIFDRLKIAGCTHAPAPGVDGGSSLRRPCNCPYEVQPIRAGLVCPPMPEYDADDFADALATALKEANAQGRHVLVLHMPPYTAGWWLMRVEMVHGFTLGAPRHLRRVHMSLHESLVGPSDDPNKRYIVSGADVATQLRPALVLDGPVEAGGAFVIEPTMAALLAARHEERRRSAGAKVTRQAKADGGVESRRTGANV
eukprot:jgi/Chrpa1/2448/Chrysochromulina_OHIO_Genome00018160-RA